jgi:DNA helicase-2/ATP-dependent DNA helicase PcrA
MPAAHDLNDAQLQAVQHLSGPLLLLAGAGSGKTRVITYRLAELLSRGVDPDRILAVTFTNKAAGELRERTERLFASLAPPESDDSGFSRPRSRAPRWIGTFHSIGARLLRRLASYVGLPSDFTILDDDDQLKLCKELCVEMNLDELAMPPRALRGAIDRAKNQCLLPDKYQGKDYFTDLVAKLYTRYQARLLELGAADFGDLLLLPVMLCERNPQMRQALGSRFEHVLVDEFQDVNTVQYRLLLYLAERSRNLVVVGDDDQAIYGWRGADVRLLLDFERDWPDAHVVKLEENYRSTQVILDAAHAVVERNPQRRDKRLYTRKLGGDPILCHQAYDERAEAKFVVQAMLYMSADEGYLPGEFAIIYRTNAQSRVLEEALRAQDLPYTVVGGMRFYDRAEVKDILAYLRLCQNPADELALLRIFNRPRRGIGETTIAKLQAHARLGGVPLWQAMQDALHDDSLLKGAARKKLATFVTLVQQLRELAAQVSLTTLAKEVVSRTGYLQALSPDDIEDQSRIQNVSELIGSIEEQEAEIDSRLADQKKQQEAAGTSEAPLTKAAAEALDNPLFDDDDTLRPLTLPDYLQRVALQSGDETAPQGRGIQLMTAHAAKGLEFKVVFITGLEDGLFPSLRQGNQDGDEAQSARVCEERRLAYVAMTRARERLILTFAHQRRLYGGQPRIALPSRFLREIPDECLDPSGTRLVSPQSFGPDWTPGFGYSSSQPTRSRHASDLDEPDGESESDSDSESDSELRIEREDEPHTGFAGRLHSSHPDDQAAAMFTRGRRRAPSTGFTKSSPSRSGPQYGGPQRIGDVISGLLPSLPGAPSSHGHAHAPRREPEPPSSDLRVVYETDETSGGFAVGQAVRHAKYGLGRVQGLSGHYSGAMLTIRFADGQTKTIQSSYVSAARESDFQPEGS